MSGANATLRAILVERYNHLRVELGRKLRSPELAQEALHDTYVKLQNSEEIREVEKPIGYLIRIALNVARDRQRSGKRLASMEQIEHVLNLADGGADPEQSAVARSEMDTLAKILEELPPRRRAILLAAFKDNMKASEIAGRFGLTKRRINMELKLGREQCIEALARGPKK
jgi:RNA polymerase sigma factor (sigma-70 family)